MICHENVTAMSLKMRGHYFQLLTFQQISKVIVFTAAPCHAWHLGPDATLLIIWRRWWMWTVSYLVFFQVSWSPLASPLISKVIEFTVAPCHAWHPGPDATLLMIWRRQRMWMQVYLVLCTASQSLPPPWVHVFSKSCANSSLRTQYAAAASADAHCANVFHRRLRRARKSAVNRISTFEKWLSPPIRSKFPSQKLTLRL